MRLHQAGRCSGRAGRDGDPARIRSGPDHLAGIFCLSLSVGKDAGKPEPVECGHVEGGDSAQSIAGGCQHPAGRGRVRRLQWDRGGTRRMLAGRLPGWEEAGSDGPGGRRPSRRTAPPGSGPGIRAVQVACAPRRLRSGRPRFRPHLRPRTPRRIEREELVLAASSVEALLVRRLTVARVFRVARARLRATFTDCSRAPRPVPGGHRIGLAGARRPLAAAFRTRLAWAACSHAAWMPTRACGRFPAHRSRATGIRQPVAPELGHDLVLGASAGR